MYIIGGPVVLPQVSLTPDAREIPNGPETSTPRDEDPTIKNKLN